MDFQIAAELSEFPVVIRWPVQWGDQDAFGHVNNIIYFRWFESARIVYLHRVALERKEESQIGPILAAINCNFRRQLNFPDHVQIGARVTRLGNSSFTMVHRLYSEAQRAVAADGESTIVVFDYQQQRSCPIPDTLRRAIEELERGDAAARAASSA
jgi:acyl-CoA thioester hydrolase